MWIQNVICATFSLTENGNTVANFIATAFGINMKYFM